MDFLLPRPNVRALVDRSKGREDRPAGDGRSLAVIAACSRKKSSRRIVVHRKTLRSPVTSAIARDVDALDVEHFVKELTPGRSNV